MYIYTHWGCVHQGCLMVSEIKFGSLRPPKLCFRILFIMGYLYFSLYIYISTYVYIIRAPWAHMGQGPYGPASQSSCKAFMPPWEGQGALKCPTCAHKDKPVSTPPATPTLYIDIYISRICVSSCTALTTPVLNWALLVLGWCSTGLDWCLTGA